MLLARQIYLQIYLKTGISTQSGRLLQFFAKIVRVGIEQDRIRIDQISIDHDGLGQYFTSESGGTVVANPAACISHSSYNRAYAIGFSTII